MRPFDFIMFGLLTMLASAIGSSIGHGVLSVPFSSLVEVLK